jgi:hypothetical protein
MMKTIRAILTVGAVLGAALPAFADPAGSSPDPRVPADARKKADEKAPYALTGSDYGNARAGLDRAGRRDRMAPRQFTVPGDGSRRDTDADDR